MHHIIINLMIKRKKREKNRIHWSYKTTANFHNLQSSGVLLFVSITTDTFFSIIFSIFSFTRWLFMELIFMHWTVSIAYVLNAPESWMKLYKLSVSRLLDSCSDHKHKTKQNGDLNGGETNILATRIDVESLNRPIMRCCCCVFFLFAIIYIEFFTMVSK